ncbi:hypothetical protein LG293_16255 (plasmid) [Citricoccus nitrophenolicus]
MTQNTAHAARPRHHRSVTVLGELQINLTLWRALTWAMAIIGLGIGLTAEATNGQTVLAIVFFGGFAWMGTRRFAE